MKVNWGFVDRVRVRAENGGGAKGGVGQEKVSDGSMAVDETCEHAAMRSALIIGREGVL